MPSQVLYDWSNSTIINSYKDSPKETAKFKTRLRPDDEGMFSTGYQSFKDNLIVSIDNKNAIEANYDKNAKTLSVQAKGPEYEIVSAYIGYGGGNTKSFKAKDGFIFET